MTVGIKPFRAYIEEKYLYDMDPFRKAILPCEVLAVSAYMGQSLTFTVMINGAMFANIPVFALRWKDNEITGGIADENIAFKNCPDKNIDVFVLDKLCYNKPICFVRQNAEWYPANSYILTVDFYDDNELLHLMMLDNYQLGWFPNHKINWDGKRELPNYKKLKQNWNI